MSEYMGGDMLGDTGPLTEAAELPGYCRVGEWVSSLVQEDKGLIGDLFRVITFPLDEVFFCHDEPDVPGFSGLEGDIDNYAGPVKFESSPSHFPNFSDPKAPLVHGDDHGPVPGGHTGGEECLEVIVCQEV